MPRTKSAFAAETVEKKHQPVAMLRIREMILQGALAPGERVREADIAERLKISRTPVRQALPALAQEGLLVVSGKRGYAVRAFTPRESLEAIELRAVLEGIAARSLAERGISRELLADLRACLAAGDTIFAKRTIIEEDELRYGEMNSRFHRLILEGAGRPLLIALTERCSVVPFAAPLTIAFSSHGPEAMFDLLFYAHQQHHSIVDAIQSRDGGRAELLFREHAFTQKKSMSLEGGLNKSVLPAI